MTHPWSATIDGSPDTTRSVGAPDPVLTLPVLRAPVYGGIKLGLEWVGALVLLVSAFPILMCLAALLKCTSDGPVLYSQIRLGRGGRPFRMYKLRTMTHGCEAVTGPIWSVGNDPRVTKVGRWLRDTHFDELPQLWNVLRGEMGLIGPRPERPEIASIIELSLPEFRSRLLVRPGITGLAQMQLPADSELHAVRHKLARDFIYIRNLGPLLDLRIALSTVCHLAGHVFTATSRRLVLRFTPRMQSDAVQHEAPLSLTGAARNARDRQAKPAEELSRAA